MAGSSRRRGAVRKSGKGPTVGSGGQRRRALEGKGPTPKAVDREHHPAHRRAEAAAGTGTRPVTGTRPSRHAARPARAARPTAGRSGGGTELVAGRNAVVEALRAEIPATALYLAVGVQTDDRVREALKAAAARGIPVLQTPRGDLDRVTDGAVHQGLALQVPPYAYAALADLREPDGPGIPLLVALDGVTDPRNLGAVIRSVAAFGGHGVVVPERRSAGVTAAAWKSSAGAAARVPVAQVVNLTRALTELKTAGFFAVGLDMGGSLALPALALAERPLVLVVGSEGRGLSRLVAQTCDEVVSIPMAGALESLNAGVAASVALYEIARRRAGPQPRG
ncbi:MAG: 23S rRNA (guanosine(2251)-2'-O)-methyltransferase RlmB [Dermatophilaceae bacterium]